MERNKKLIVIISISVIAILSLVLYLKNHNKNAFRDTFTNKTYKYVSGNEIPEGTTLNKEIKITKLYDLVDKDKKNNNFIYNKTIILIDSSPIIRELNKGITSCWKQEDDYLIQIECDKYILDEIANKYGINSYASYEVLFNLKYKLNK